MIHQSREEWLTEGKNKFGDNFLNWKFKCPRCGRINSVKEFKDAGADRPDRAATNCIGRYDRNKGCDWAAYGLLGTLGKGRIVTLNNGEEVEVFDFA